MIDQFVPTTGVVGGVAIVVTALVADNDYTFIGLVAGTFLAAGSVVCWWLSPPYDAGSSTPVEEDDAP